MDTKGINEPIPVAVILESAFRRKVELKALGMKPTDADYNEFKQQLIDNAIFGYEDQLAQILEL